MSASVDTDLDTWGREIEQETVRGVSYRTYPHRPRHVADLLGLADRWADRPHLVQGSRVVVFADLHQMVAAKASTLAELGVGAGDRVMIMGFNSPEWIANFWACLSVGGVPVLANAWWSAADVENAVTLMGLRLSLADGRASALLPASVAVGPWECPLAEPAVAAPQITVGEDDPAVIVFTSGTAGRPKAVVLSHRSLLAGLHMLLDVTKRLPQQVGDETGDPGLHTGPMFHIGGVQTLMRAVVVGDTLVMPAGRFDAQEAIRLIEQWRIARWSAVPTMISRVLEHPDVHQRDLSSLRSVTAGGAPIHAEFIAALRSGLPGATPRVATGYGLTENGGQATAASGHDTTQRPGTCGRPLPCVEIDIAGDDDSGVGEVLVRSPTQMLGYYGEEDSPIDEQGWLHTGDLGRVDDDGYLWITGRSKDLIIRGGENIAPAAVEEALSSVPGVAESSVFGVPHVDLGEEVMAVVSVRSDIGEDDLVRGAREHLASFAVPSRWRILHEPLPTNHAGKVDKPSLRAQAVAELQTSSEVS